MFRETPFFLLLIIVLETAFGAVLNLHPEYPLEIFQIEPNSIEIENAYFGIWSKYLPLSNTTQIGNIGILDSNCFHLLHVKDRTTERINFLYYLCLEEDTKAIYTYLQFIDNAGLDHQYKIQFSEEFYESTWQHIAFCTIPNQKEFTIFYQSPGQPTKSIEVLTIPFYDKQLNLIYGGGLVVNDNQLLQTSYNKKLSQFPGKIYYDQYIVGKLNCDSMFQDIQYFDCKCSENDNSAAIDKVIERQNDFLFISQEANCQEFFLSTWIKIEEIQIFENVFYYQFMKLSGNFINPLLIDDNLSAFTLTYKITSKGNQIIITTYSYTFPLIKTDFSNNPYLIKHVFDVNSDIKRWHYLIVWKQERNISISITFYDKQNQEKLEFKQEVKQFGCVQFQLHIGNILQSLKQYLKIQINGFTFFNCPTIIDQTINCHPTCKECDGPTKYDCISCFESSNRTYIPDFNQCICNYGTIDQDNICFYHKSLNLNILPGERINNKCKYGYYEQDSNCERCPSRISDNLITCLECLQNTKNWKTTFCCQISLYTDNEGNIFEKINDFLCVRFKLPDDPELDIGLFDFLPLNNSITEDIPTGLFTPLQKCHAPNFINFEQQCTSCPINYCQYCFGYFETDQTKTTLGSIFNYSVIGEEIKTGCAQCIDGFIYSFKLEQCIFKSPSHPNCLMSYLQKDGQEICTLSAIDDFSIAPVIINCQNHILNCKQCIQTPELVLKCLICEDGYMASSYNGICIVIVNSFSKISLLWRYREQEPWKWYIQGFKIKFLHLTTVEKNLVGTLSIYEFECLDGYQIIDRKCYKYCDDNCQICKKNAGQRYYFSCQKCDLNYYKIPNRVQIDGKCIECPPFCQICEQRSTEEIKQINPYFILTPENIIFSYKCLKKIPLATVIIDQYSQCAHYCFNDACNYLFEYKVGIFQENYFGEQHYQYFNYIGLKEISLIYQFNFIYLDMMKKYFQIANYLKDNVFSIQFVQLIIEGEFKPFFFETQIEILYFNSITIKNVHFLIQTKFELIINNRETTDFLITDTSFYSQQSNSIQLQIYGGSYQNYQLSNIFIFDAIIENSQIFQITSQEQGDIIKISNLQLSNCTFKNSTLLFFSTLSRKIMIENLVINSCKFYTSPIIQSNISLNNIVDIIINNVNIQNSLFSESSFILSDENSDITITKFQLFSCQIIGSRFISFSKNFYLTDILVEENLIQEALFLIQISSNNRNSLIGIQNFQLCKNNISSSVIVVTELSFGENQVKFKCQNFYFENNIQDAQKDYQYLFQINCHNLVIQDFILKNTVNFRFFSFIAIPFLRIQNIIYENQYQQEKVEINFDCYKNGAIKSQLLFVQGFSSISLEQITIINQISIDLSIISIQSNSKFILNTIEYVSIRDVTLIGNILLKQSLMIQLSLIDIYSEITQILNMESIIFQENIFHQYQINPSQNSASLIQINSGSSNVSLKNIICSHNVLTNSSNSFISIYTNELYIQDFQTANHNYLNTDLWNKYYQLLIQEEFSQSQIISIIKNTYKIESISGALSIKAQKFNFMNGFFSNIIASSSLIFNINLQGDGIVIIRNCNIENSQSQLISTSKVDGAITIDATKSLLTIEIENLNLSYVQNRISSSIFSIYPSSIKNNIQLKKIYAYNCFSLQNQLIYLEFNFNNPQQNKVSIQYLHIIQSENAFINYLQSIERVSIVEIQNIVEKNAILHLVGGWFLLKGIIIEGIILSSIIKIVDYHQIIITDSQFLNISTFYSLHLLEFSQLNNVLQQNLIMNNISIINENSFQINKYQINYNQTNLNVKEMNECALISQFVEIPTEGLQSINTFFEKIKQYSQQKGSLIYFSSITNQTQMLIRKIQIQNNDCQNCWNGLVFFDLTELKFIKINEISCIKNFIKRNGCILIISEKILDRQIKMENLNFISNNGTKGAGLQNNQQFCIRKRRRIYFNLYSNGFLLNQTLVCQNLAKEGGGIYLEGNSSLNQQTFFKSLNLYNSASLSSNNINELPSHLGLQINNQEMHSVEHKIDNQSIYILELNPYNILVQNQIQRTKYLTIPSGQIISNFQLYNPKIFKYVIFLKEISIIFKNSMNEKQLNYLNSTCNVTQNVFDIQSHQIIETAQLQSISFNPVTNSFNLDQTQFNFDPYSQNDKIFIIKLGCKTQYIDKILFYQMRVNIFLCQLGEYYIQDICLKCQPDQGFYSVTYNATKCSIFDKNKFQAITSNQIQLKPGYWRPNYISDQIEICYKSINQCLGGWSVGDETCNIGYIGGLCEECDKLNIKGDGPFFKNQQQLVCQYCQEPSKRLIAFLLLSIWSVLSTLLTIRSIEKSNFLIMSFKLRQKFADILFNLCQDHVSILLKLYLNYLWIFSLIQTINMNFSFSFGFIKQSTDTSYFMANFFDCSLSDLEGIELIYSRIILTISLLLCQILLIQSGSSLLEFLTSYRHRSRIISITVLNLYIQNYASMITQFFSVLAIRNISQVSYIQGDVSLLYGSDNHNRWIYRFILPGLTLIGFILPFSLFIFLYTKRNQLKCLKYKRHFGYLYNEYTQNNYYWEWIRLWKKTILIIVLINFETQILLKASLLGFCLQIYQFFTEKFKPYLLKRFNQLDLQTSQLCSYAIFISSIKYTCDQSNNYSISAILQMIIILICLTMSQPFVSVILQEYYKRFKPTIIEFLLALVNTFRPNSQIIKYLRRQLILLRQKENKIRQNFMKLKLAVGYQKQQINNKSNIKFFSNISKKTHLIDFQSKQEKQI